VTERVGILHPGEMGISLAASAKNSGCEVYWVSEGRGLQTRQRAAQFELRDTGTLAELGKRCTIVISVCPPVAAETMANDVIAAGFNGIYLDANAIAPRRTIRIGHRMSDAGIRFVDGGIIGFPAWKPGTTCLYLSGPQAAEVARCFSAGPLETKIIGASIGKDVLRSEYEGNRCATGRDCGNSGKLGRTRGIIPAVETGGPGVSRGREKTHSSQHAQSMAVRWRDGRDIEDFQRSWNPWRIPCGRCEYL
jgi:NAD binding domain of 6-phosphogluconate dehydrogenase